MSNGWIKLHRQIEENELWFLEPFTKAQAWIDLLLMANHDLNVFLVRGNRVEVKRGQVARAATTFADRWRWSKGKVLTYFGHLEKMGMIDRRISNVIAVISIKNYDQYQSTEPQDEPQKVRRKSAESPQTDPNKKENNEKNEKNSSAKEPQTHLYPYAMFCHLFGIQAKSSAEWSELIGRNARLSKKLAGIDLERLATAMVLAEDHWAKKKDYPIRLETVNKFLEDMAARGVPDALVARRDALLKDFAENKDFIFLPAP